MNLPNKISIFRMILVLLIIILFVFPFHNINLEFPIILVEGNNITIPVSTKYLTIGVIFIIAAISDFFDGYLARKHNLITTFGQFIDPIADKLLVNTTLILLIGDNAIHPLVGVVLIGRDIVVDAIRMIASSSGKIISAGKYGKYKTFSQMIGIILVLFYNLPFELINIKVADFFLILSMIFSIVSGIEYYLNNKKYILGSM